MNIQLSKGNRCPCTSIEFMKFALHSPEPERQRASEPVYWVGNSSRNIGKPQLLWMLSPQTSAYRKLIFPTSVNPVISHWFWGLTKRNDRDHSQKCLRTKYRTRFENTKKGLVTKLPTSKYSSYTCYKENHTNITIKKWLNYTKLSE